MLLVAEVYRSMAETKGLILRTEDIARYLPDAYLPLVPVQPQEPSCTGSVVGTYPITVRRGQIEPDFGDIVQVDTDRLSVLEAPHRPFWSSKIFLLPVVDVLIPFKTSKSPSKKSPSALYR